MSEESPDKWVIQDRVPVRDCDIGWWVSDAQPLPAPEMMWGCRPSVSNSSSSESGKKHGDKWTWPVKPGEQIPTLYVMCRLKDLPPLPEEPPLPEIMCKCKDPAAPCETSKDDHPDLLIDAALRLSHWVKNYGHLKQQALVDDLNRVLDAISKQASDSAKPKEPLRWVENCVPDKPGIWACLTERECKEISVHDVNESEVKSGYLVATTRCYLGPIPEILPPKRKVVERLYLEAVANGTEPNTVLYRMHWCDDEQTKTHPINWIVTHETRRREIEQ